MLQQIKISHAEIKTQRYQQGRPILLISLFVHNHKLQAAAVNYRWRQSCILRQLLLDGLSMRFRTNGCLLVASQFV